jgi:HEAT repeat protein
MAAVHDVDAAVRCRAVEALRSWSDAEAENLLLTCADDPDSGVRIQVAWALAGVRRPEARAIIRRLLEDDEVHVRHAASQVSKLLPPLTTPDEMMLGVSSGCEGRSV